MVKRKPHSGGSLAGPSQRQLRVGEELRHVLSSVLLRGHLRDPALEGVSITVTEVRISPDLRNATAYVMPLGELTSDAPHAPEVLAALNRSAAYLRGQIAREITLRHVPAIRFVYDSAFESSARIDTVLLRPDVRRDLDNQRRGSDEDEDSGDGA
ncbi:30S ribosome-binding factor RbfA [Oceanibaculum indicum]|uniref:Ribosome-binding factor A n=1 Tax=Oceanibaculum indicum TaxID=526216 RepID=A0A420WCL6_9PROT|nr:30S ribosome-binding factor RbfA [Oceanibaculum indicum]RKQ68718.1 ribosome-binding factor A [Oceanibaculum indicum]